MKIKEVEIMKRYAYIRVSTKEQNIARQVEAMKAIGILEKHMFIDKQSGKDFLRNEYCKLLRIIKEGDTIYIKSIDRLGRNYDEIIEQWHTIVKRNVDIVVLDFPLLNTKEQVNGLTGKFIADLVLQILSYVAQIERENIKQRQKEGIAIAKENGARFGRKRKEKPKCLKECYGMWKNHTITEREAARRMHVSNHTVKRWFQELECNETNAVSE